MARPRTSFSADAAYHVLNRGNSRARLFETEKDYLAFENTLSEAIERAPVRLYAYCVMPNHWHLLASPHPGLESELPHCIYWLSLTHAIRWRAYRNTRGEGHVYQGRYKAVPVTTDTHLLTVARYIERNPLAADLVARAEDWRWSSMHWRVGRRGTPRWLVQPPTPFPSDWAGFVNQQLPSD